MFLKLSVLKQLSKRSWILLGSAVVVVMVAAGFLVLIFPNNPLTNFFSVRMSDTRHRVVVGPYPNEAGFEILKQNNIKTVVSLLNPWVPYERILLDRERAAAEKYGIQVLNFPMTSVLGRGMGAEYSKNASDAAEAIAHARGKVYMHCYLGLHRAKVVQDMVKAKGVRIGAPIIAETERPDDVWLRDNAQAAFEAGDYQLAIDRLKRISAPDEASRLLVAWSNYRLGDVAGARQQFEQIVKESGNSDARTGLAYAALRQNDLDTADQQFTATLKKHPASVPALTGLGIVRFRQGRGPEACRLLDEALELAPGNSEAVEIRSKLNCEARPAATR